MKRFICKWALWLGLVGWGSAALVTPIIFFHFLSQKECYFLSAWPTCVPFNDYIRAGLIGIFIVCISALWFFFSKNKDNNFFVGGHKKMIFFVVLCAFLVVPFSSGDIEYYFSSGKAAAGGKNLYTNSWLLENPFFSPPQSSFTYGSMYGPLAIDLFKIAYYISSGSMWWFIFLWKTFMVFMFVVLGYVIEHVFFNDDFLTSERRLYIQKIWFLQPLLLWEWIVNGHFDSVWLLALSGSFLAAKKHHWWLVFPLLALGVWVKFIPVLLVPWFLLWWWQEIKKTNWQRQIVQLGLGFFLSFLVTFVAWRPYWVGLRVFDTLITQSKWAVSSLFATFYYSLEFISQALGVTFSHLLLTGLVHGMVVCIASFLLWPLAKEAWLIFRHRVHWSSQRFFTAILITLLVFLFVWQKSFWPWYGAWVLPLLGVLFVIYDEILFDRFVLFLGIAPLGFYVWQALAHNNVSHLSFFWCIFLTITVYPLILVFKWRCIAYVVN